MEKSISSPEYGLFLSTLKEVREEKGLSQTEVAERLGKTQSFVSKVERGERRLDIVEVRTFCIAIGVSFPSFIDRIERSITSGTSPVSQSHNS